jgi:hypothetical protein
VESFYDSLGGLVGYQLKSLQLISGTDEAGSEGGDGSSSSSSGGGGAPQPPQQPPSYMMPPSLDLSGEDGGDCALREVAAGLRAMPHLAEIYPVGGEARARARAPPSPSHHHQTHAHWTRLPPCAGRPCRWPGTARPAAEPG